MKLCNFKFGFPTELMQVTLSKQPAGEFIKQAFVPLAQDVPTEVPCNHVVDFAKAQVQEGNSSHVLREFAAVSLNDAEKGCHQVFKKYGYVAPVEIEFACLGEGKLAKFPFIRLSKWAQWLLDTQRIWRLFCGASSFERMQEVLAVFWSRFREAFPGHDIFDALSPDELNTCIPFYTHQDEGRGPKHEAVWVFSSHGCVGRGTAEYVRKGKHKLPLDRCPLGLNFLGNTQCTQYLFCTMKRSVLEDCPGAVDALMQIFAADCSCLLFDGLTSQDGKTIRMAHISTKGDLPALNRLGSFTRTFWHVPRAQSSKKACKGICPWCLAGREAGRPGERAFPFEDLSLNPVWEETIESEIPWGATMPPIMEGAPLNRDRKAHFFSLDIFHNVHLGVGKQWLACSFAACVERLEFWPETHGSVDARFELMTSQFKDFCRQRHISPHMTEISRATLAFPSSTASPVGQWSKGSMTTNFMLFLEFFLVQHAADCEDPIIQTMVIRLVYLIVFFVCVRH